MTSIDAAMDDLISKAEKAFVSCGEGLGASFLNHTRFVNACHPDLIAAMARVVKSSWHKPDCEALCDEWCFADGRSARDCGLGDATRALESLLAKRGAP